MSTEAVASDAKFRVAPEELAEIVTRLRKKVKLLDMAVIHPLLVTSKEEMVGSAIASRRERDLYRVHAYLLVAEPTWERITGATERGKRRDLIRALRVALFRELACMYWDGEKLSAEKPLMEHPAVIKEFGLDAPGVREHPLVRAVMDAQLKLIDLQTEEDQPQAEDEEPEADEPDEGEVTDLGEFRQAAH